MTKEVSRAGWWYWDNSTRFTILYKQLYNTKNGCPRREYLVMDHQQCQFHRFIITDYMNVGQQIRDIIGSLKARDEQ